MISPSYPERCYFFDRGLYFECRQCGACCNGSPGIVRIGYAELASIANHLNLSPSALQALYLTPYQDFYTAREDSDGRCLFYAQGCRIYPVRPEQCRSFPLWPDNLRSPENWRNIASQCPGIGTGRFYDRQHILRALYVPEPHLQLD